MNDEFDNSNNFSINKDVLNDYNLGSSTPKKKKRNILIPVILILIIITFVSYDGLPFNSADEQEKKEVAAEQYKVSKKNIPSELPFEFSPISNYYDIDIIDPEIIGKKIAISLKLTEPVKQNEEPYFYFFDPIYGEWHRLTKATLNLDANIASAEIPKLPNNILVVSSPAQVRYLSLNNCIGCDVSIYPKYQSNSIMISSPDLVGLDDKLTLKNLNNNSSIDVDNFHYGVVANDKRSSEIIEYILGDTNRIDEHIQNIMTEAKKLDANGIHINYQNVKVKNKKSFSTFINRLSDILINQSFDSLIVSLPVNSNINDSSYDWKLIAEIVDRIWVHPIEDGSKFYKELDAFMVSINERGIASEKLHIVLNSMTKERSIDGVKSISRIDALKIATEFSAAIEQQAITPNMPITLNALNLNTLNTGNNQVKWDDISQSVSFRYNLNSSERSVWIQNSFSLRFQLFFSEKNQFGGVVIDANNIDAQSSIYWELLNKYISSSEIELLKPFEDYVKVDWTATDGIFENNNGKSVTWRAPEKPGVYKLQLNVSDGEIFLSTEVMVNVVAEKSSVLHIDSIISIMPQITIEKIIIEPIQISVDKKPNLEVNNQQQSEALTDLKVIRYQPIPIGPPGPAGN